MIDLLCRREEGHGRFCVERRVRYNFQRLFWRRSSEEEQGTHKPWVVGSNPIGATVVLSGEPLDASGFFFDK
jgi:hypothetical protein